MEKRERDIYGRKPTSNSRGRTDERIMALQHAKGTLPGAEGLLDGCGDGSIGAAITRFHVEFVEPKPVTSRRAYERSLVFLLRDLAEVGPNPTASIAELSEERLAAHLDWRVAHGLTHAAELSRAGVHLGHIGEWLDANCNGSTGTTRDRMREAASQFVAR
jgi:hypothetical protein